MLGSFGVFPQGAPKLLSLRSTPAICSFNRDDFLSRDRNASACRALCDMDRLFLSITAVSLIVLVTTISLGAVPMAVFPH